MTRFETLYAHGTYYFGKGKTIKENGLAFYLICNLSVLYNSNLMTWYKEGCYYSPYILLTKLSILWLKQFELHFKLP